MAKKRGGKKKKTGRKAARRPAKKHKKAVSHGKKRAIGSKVKRGKVIGHVARPAKSLCYVTKRGEVVATILNRKGR